MGVKILNLFLFFKAVTLFYPVVSLAARENRLGRALACDVRPGFGVQGLGFGVCAMPPGFRV